MLKLILCLGIFFSSIILFLLLISMKVINLSVLEGIDQKVLQDVGIGLGSDRIQ